MNVYDQAHGLARAIRESEEFKQYNSLKEQHKDDPMLQNLIQQMADLQMRSQTQMDGQGNVPPELAQEFQRLSLQMMANPEAAEYVQALMRFSLMINDVVQIVADETGIDVPKMDQMPGF